MKDEELKQWREAFRSGSLDEPLESIGADVLADLLLKDMKTESEAALIEHLIQSPENMAMIKTGLQLKKEMASLSKREKWLQKTSWLALAAAVLLVTIGVWRLWLPGLNDPGFENFVDDTVTRDQQKTMGVSPVQDSKISESPHELWIDLTVTHETAFQFVILDSDGTIVWESEKLLQPRTILPEPIRLGLKTGTYFWFVQYYFSENERRYGPFRFSVL